MARCERCYGCQFMFDTSPCDRCNYPHADTRSPEQIEQDTKDQREMEMLDDDD